MARLALVTLVTVVGCTNNEPQYVECAPMGPAATDVCKLQAGMDDGMGGLSTATGSLHVPLLPEARWKASDRERRTSLQADVDKITGGGVDVGVYRLEHYDLSVEWFVRNLATTPGQFRIDLNGANEAFAYDPSMFVVADDEDPPPPPLAGNIPIDIAAQATMTGVFREDQLREAAIDLDQITRGNVNAFAAMLTINKQDDEFQPVTPLDTTTDPPTGGDPVGPPVPREAWRNIIRVDVTFRPNVPMEIEYALRLREHTDIVPDKGLNAAAEDLYLMDPPAYTASLP